MPSHRKATPKPKSHSKSKAAARSIKLAQPDRTGPTDQTLLELAQERGLFAEAEARRRQLRRRRKPGDADEDGEPDEEEEDDDDDGADADGEETADEGADADDDDAGIGPWVERLLESLLWTASIASLHLMLDVLVQHQYAVEMEWWKVALRTARAFVVFVVLFYVLHPHAATDPPSLRIPLPTFLLLAPSARRAGQLRVPTAMARQAVFLAASVAAGCYLVHVTNRHGYLAVMKQAPSVGCLWVWSVVELRLGLALVSLACVGLFLKAGEYEIK